MNKSVIKLFVLPFLLFVTVPILSGEVSANPDHPFASGSGTEQDPYVIETADQLDQLRNYLDAHFELGADIDLSGYSAPDGKGWMPIGMNKGYKFTGNFDGIKHTISNLTINRPYTDGVGLFNEIGYSTIKDLFLKNISIKGASSGGLSGYIHHSTVKKIAVNGIVEAEYTVGGLAGYAYYTSLSESSFIGDVNVSENYSTIGGIFGSSREGKVENVFTEGTINPHSSYQEVGGLIGASYKDSIKNSYTAMSLEGEEQDMRSRMHFVSSARDSSIQNSFGVIPPQERKGNFVGYDSGSSINNSFWIERNNHSKLSNLIYPEWNFTSVWTMETGDEFPTLMLSVDKIPPVTTLTIPEVHENGWFNNHIPLEFSVNEDAIIQYRKNDGEWTQYTTPESLGDGEWTVDYFSTDKSGNVEDIKSVQLKVDTTKPLTTMELEGTKGKSDWYVSDPTFTLSPADGGSGIDATEYRLNKGEWISYNSPVTLQEGMHNVEFRSIDGAGNVEDTQTIGVNVDTTVPELEVGLNKYELWSPNHKMKKIQSTLTYSDAMSEVDSVELVSITSNEDDDSHDDIQGAEYGTEDTEFSLRAERSGKKSGRVYTITYLITDYAGNDLTEVATVDVPHDKGKSDKKSNKDKKGKKAK
ncbi:OmpL47-type beta-barrel domain-containing protein [Pseudalkalibacillus hwajinpoensis]|uniref:GLUG domain-containing protein n=1 Tax=Guptibacillus hwajinpoensis TaxID=208199 RepID=A0A4U1MIY9_9BACL|nr:GLUG motif-containing protein [Pseudalkalibacillus hwajinpoensis]TKD70767.1 hypothetical protein FBF83_09135 [Pseudalkalibacillus hwajinpoensis]